MQQPHNQDAFDLGLDTSGYSRDVEPEVLDTTEGPEAPRGDEIRHPFDPNRIDIKTKPMTVDLVLARLRRNLLHLNPEFQRNSGIWRTEKQSQLIESLLLRIPLPTFYAAEVDTEESWEMVDGVQRLTTIARFIEPSLVNQKPLRLTGLQYLHDLNGCFYDDLPGGLKTRIHETELLVHVIGRGTPEEVKFNVFARINTGGVPLTLQELRHALIPGRSRDLLATLAASASFQRATQGRVRDLRMSDREMVLRFLAFRLSDPSAYSSSDLDEFLRHAMQDINELGEESVRALSEDFDRAMDASYDVFGQQAFRKQSRGQDRMSPINKALFEAASVNLAKRTDSQIIRLINASDAVNEGLKDLMADQEFDRAISWSTGDIRKVRIRFADIDELFRRHEGE